MTATATQQLNKPRSDSMATGEPGLSARRLGWAVALVLALASIVPIWIGEYFISQNGPEYLLFSHMLAEWDNPEFDYQEHYEPLAVLPPNVVTQVVNAGLLKVLPPLVVWKLTLTVTILLFPLSVYYFLRAARPENAGFALCAFLYSYNYYIFKGYENFYLSVCLFFLFFGYLLRHEDRLTWPKTSWLMVQMLVIYLCHMMAFLVAMLILPIYLALTRRNWKREIRVTVALLPTVILFLHYAYAITSLSDDLLSERGSWLRYGTARETLVYYVEMVMFSISQPALYLFIGAMLYVYATALWCVVRAGWQHRGWKPWRDGMLDRRHAMMWLTVLLSLVYFAAPREIAGWPKFNERMLPFVFVLLLACAAWPRRVAWQRLYAGGIAVASLALVVLFSREVVAAQPLYREYLSGIPVLERNQKLLPVHVDKPQLGRIRPIIWSFNYYNLYRGGATGTSVVQYVGRVPMQYRGERREVFPPFDPADPQAADMDRIADAYDYVLIWGVDEAVRAQFEEAGFHVVHREGRLSLHRRNDEAGEDGS